MQALLEQFALPCARDERISLVKILFATRQNLQTNSKDALELSELVRIPEVDSSGVEKIFHAGGLIGSTYLIDTLYSQPVGNCRSRNYSDQYIECGIKAIFGKLLQPA